MEPDDLSGLSSLGHSREENLLFPQMGSERVPNRTSTDSAVSQELIQKLGSIFRGWGREADEQENFRPPKNTYSSSSDSKELRTDDDMAFCVVEDDEVDLSDLRTGSSSSDHYTLDSSIIRKVGDEIAEGEPGPESKFRFLSLYETFARAKQHNTPDAASIFGLSDLNDFDRFVKKSQIDESINQRVKESSASPAALLSVVDNNELIQNYTEKEDDLGEGSSRLRSKPRLPWIGRNREGLYASKSDIEELRVAGKSLSSGDSNGSGEKIFLQRKLKVRHLQMISLGGTLGVGLYLNSGKAFTIAGGFGTVLAFVIVGIIVLCTIISFCEMVTFVSVVDGVSGLSARFVDESFGFATGWLYFFSFSVGLAGEIVASVIILSYFEDSKVLTNNGATVGFVTLFLAFCISSNMVDVRIFGEVEYVSSMIKVLATFLIIIIMIVINRGGLGKEGVVGFKYWQYLKSDFENNLIFGLFRPTFDLRSDGMDSLSSGIGGDLGRFLSVVTAIVIVSYAYSGTEIVCIAACEAKDPRKALPSATKRVFWRILIFYCLASFMVSLNLYAGDPRLLRYYTGLTGVKASDFSSNYAVNYVGGDNCHSLSVYAGYGNGSQSPWTVAFQSVGLCNWSSVANSFLVFFALSCGNAQLYVSSRTIYSLALQHKAPAFLKKCNRYGIPYNAVMVASAASFSAYICVSELATVIFLNLTSIILSSGVFVWFAMCLSYIRFYYGLKKRPDIISRDDKAYPYRSPFQPYSAIIGLLGSGAILLAMGYVVFLKNCWDTMFFFSSYGTLILFVILYVGHRMLKGSRMLSLEALDFDSGRRENDIYIWDGGKEYNTRSIKDIAHKIVDFMA